MKGAPSIWVEIRVVAVLNERDVEEGESVRLAQTNVGAVARLTGQSGTSWPFATLPSPAEVVGTIRDEGPLDWLDGG